MPNQLERLCHQVREAAGDADLVVFDGTPDLNDVPTAAWGGDWRTFLELATKAGATLLYLEITRHTPEALIAGIIEQHARMPFEDEDVEEDEELPEIDEGDNWLRDRLYEAAAPWDVFRDSAFRLECVWFKNGVAHLWRDEVSWAPDYHDAIQRVLHEAQQVDRRDRVLRSEEATRKLHVYANILAMHSRFPEAKSEEKRAFMAERMFSDDLRKEPPSHHLLPHSIARRASLIYWWDIEPEEHATVGERARQLHENGESVKNIAAILKISEAKVRAALKADQ